MIQASKSGKRINKDNKKTKRKGIKKRWRGIKSYQKIRNRRINKLTQRIVYRNWIYVTVEEPSEGLRLVSLKLYLSLHECSLVLSLYACFMYLPCFSSWVDDYRENPNLAMNINHIKFNILSITKLDLITATRKVILT